MEPPFDEQSSADASVVSAPPESSTRTTLIVLAAPLKLAAGAKCRRLASSRMSPEESDETVEIAVKLLPSLDHFHWPSLVSSVYEMIQTPANESESALSANEALNRLETVVVVDGVPSSAIEVRDCVVSDTVGASLTAFTVWDRVTLAVL